MAKPKDHSVYVKELEIVNPTIDVIEQYVNTATSILHKCKVCEHVWPAKPHRVLLGQQCPVCKNKRLSKERAKTHETYLKELYNNHIDVDVVEEYVNCRTKIYHRCKTCNHKWKVTPNAILHGDGCPVCAHKIIGEAPEYRNSVFASEYKDFYSRFLTDDEMKCFMPNSARNITLTCKCCGYTKTSSVNSFTKGGFRCLCDDGMSFPNKFVLSVLTQLHINIKPEYSPKWANRKRYDLYLNDYNIIIENHGVQHFLEFAKSKFRRLEDEQLNDAYKKEIAIQNGISKYIVLDCRHSTLTWIKQSIMNSELPLLLQFSETDIDWALALDYASKSLVYSVADLYKTNDSLPYIGKSLNICVATVREYLKIATELGLCTYDAQLAKKKKHKHRQPQNRTA